MNPDWKPGGGSGSVYTNDNPAIRTFEISNNAKIMLGSGIFHEITYQEFSNLFVPTEIVNGIAAYPYQKSNPWDIKVVNSVVTEITEHYIP